MEINGSAGMASGMRIVDDALFLRNITMRLPFRYGKAVLVAAPLLHLRLIMEGPDGTKVTGVAADMLPPKWFDKDPSKKFEDNIRDLIAAVRIAGNVYRDASHGGATPFDVWGSALPVVMRYGHEAGLNGLTTQFGSSLYERAVIDAHGKRAGATFHTMLRDNLLGVRPDRIVPHLAGLNARSFVGQTPPTGVQIRHTVGLGDALRDSEVPEAERRVQGLPVTVESWIREAGVHYFKIKASGDATVDGARLESIFGLLRECAPADYAVTLDGNEQFTSLAALKDWWDTLSARPALAEFWQRVLYFEQPVDRARALDVTREEVAHLGPAFPPLLIDESDDAVDTYQRAVDCGYRGVSAKNCKGVFKSIINAALAAHLSQGKPGSFFLSAEDLCNQPVVPLQQDLCVASALGVTHAERNGHHYAGLLDHLSPKELAQTLSLHGSLYEPHGDSGRLRIRGGLVDVSSLQVPGLGIAGEVEFDSMTPVDDWKFESLGIEE
jgi:hypothetical protein